MHDLAKRLRTLRKAKGISPYRLAQLTGLSKQGVLNLEADGADPKVSTLLKLAEALGVEPWKLLAGEPTSTPVDQRHDPATSTPVDQPAMPPSSTPVDLPKWVHTHADDERLMHVVWSFIEDAFDSAMAGDLESARDGLGYLLEVNGEWPPLSLSYEWHAFWHDIEPEIENAIDALDEDLAKVITRYGKVTESTAKKINAIFGKFDKCFLEEWIDDWKDERDEEQRHEAAPPTSVEAEEEED
jgi:transcriptional regulator with XRE-family HTH domain